MKDFLIQLWKLLRALGYFAYELFLLAILIPAIVVCENGVPAVILNEMNYCVEKIESIRTENNEEES